MNIDVDALRNLARMHSVSHHEVLKAVADAVTDAYAATPGAVADAVAEIDDDGTITLVTPDNTKITDPGFSRGGAAAARQGVISWVKDTERRRAVGVWADREGHAFEATVLGAGRTGELRMSIEGTTAVMPAGEQIAGENLRDGSHVTVLILAANVDQRGATKLTVSRRQPNLISRLISNECPEVRNGDVTIVGVAREPGVRTKVALLSNRDGVDAMTCVVGAGGYRMRNVMEALGAERIDLVSHNEDIAAFAAAALTPARTSGAVLLDPVRRQVQVHLRADQIAAANGVEGINMRLAQRLTRTKIVLATVED